MRYGPRLVLSLVCVVGASSIGGCLIDRSALTAPPAPVADAAGIDAVVPDAYAPPGVDAWAEEPDAFRELPDAVDVPVDATQCDSVGDPCCGGGMCNGGLFCLNDGTCGTACGDPGTTCCYTGFCRGTMACGPGGTCVTCGARGEPCCAMGTCTNLMDSCAGGTCNACGALGEPCCAGDCRGGARCGGDGRCQPGEGVLGGPCRDRAMEPRCDGWAQCNLEGVCEACGGAGQWCCVGRGCSSGVCLGVYCP